MSFLDHMEELRWHIIRAVIGIAVFALLAALFNRFIFNSIILAPGRPDFWTFEMFCSVGSKVGIDAFCIDELPFIIQSRKMTGQFAMFITSSAVVGLIASFPYVFWEIWSFIKPGLYPQERKASRGAVFYVSFLFVLGVLFGYFIVTPVSVNFLANFQVDPSVKNEFDITSYVGTVTMIVLSSGVLFQLPILVTFLTKAGIVTPQIMRQYFKHAFVIILVLAALVTPPDPISQVLITVPLLLLYQVSIWISKRILKKEQRAAAAND
jgi:sec-independent protein translocase protein TatC